MDNNPDVGAARACARDIVRNRLYGEAVQNLALAHLHHVGLLTEVRNWLLYGDHTTAGKEKMLSELEALWQTPLP